jgi:hypothetical protein
LLLEASVIIGGHGSVGSDGDEAACHAPADVLRDLLLELSYVRCTPGQGRSGRCCPFSAIGG